jgi:hypothetical protein
MPKAIWKPDFTKAPRGTIGVSYNPDGKAWWWSVAPEVKGSEAKPWLLLWRGPVYAEGYTLYGNIEDIDPKAKKALWKDSWVSNPKVK